MPAIRVAQRLAAAVLVGVAGTAGCGPSGTWTDDPGNFERAWGAAAPDGVEVVRSWDWRSGHFTREEAYFFHLRADEGFSASFAAANGLVPAENLSGTAVPDLSFTFDRPEWFAPRAGATYERWSGGSARDALVLRDGETRDVFVYASQL